MSKRGWLHGLQEQVLDQAKSSLREGDAEAYHALTEIAEQLQKLSSFQETEDKQLIKIFDANRQHQAELFPNLVIAGRNKSVVYDGKFYSPSGLGSKLMGYQVNGWTWWQYDDKGVIKPIDNIRNKGN